jgi:hypothetical protein
MDPHLAAADMINFETAVLALVAVGLLVLAKIVSDLRAEVRALRESRGGSASGTGPVPVAAPAPDDEIPPDVFAAIVSAVHFTLGDAHRIVSVSPANALAWSREGRRSIFRSHTFR